jgi:hypothetical protein
VILAAILLASPITASPMSRRVQEQLEGSVPTPVRIEVVVGVVEKAEQDGHGSLKASTHTFASNPGRGNIEIAARLPFSARFGRMLEHLDAPFDVLLDPCSIVPAYR